MKQKNYIMISDLGCAAAILSIGFEISHLDRSDMKKVLFAFIKTQETEKATSDYWNNKLTVNALLMANNIKNLKNQIYSK